MRLDKKTNTIYIEPKEDIKCNNNFCKKDLTKSKYARLGTIDKKIYCEDCVKKGLGGNPYLNIDGWVLISIKMVGDK